MAYLARLLAPLTGAMLITALPACADEVRGVSVNLFADFYYGGALDQTQAQRRPGFLFNHTDTDEPQLNLGLVQFAVQTQSSRARLGLMAGSYVQENLAQEPGWANNLFEMNVGIALDGKQAIWLDLGILPSHIGFESAMSSRNPTLTRSLAAENSPYYLTGARLSWAVDARWSVAAMVVTGWQRTEPVDGNSLPGVGTQVVYSPSDSLTVNWSTFIGTDDPDDTRRMRYFNNFYLQHSLSPALDLTLGLDVGLQQEARGSDSYDVWFTPTAILRYALSANWATALRAEYYRDTAGVIVDTANDRGIRTWGCSWNLDWRYNAHVLMRMEARHLADPAAIYERGNGRFRRHSTSLLGSIVFEF